MKPLVLVIVAFAIVAGWLANERRTSGAGETANTASTAFREKKSGVWIEDAGRVETLLRDDDEGSRHQRFILRLQSRGTLLVSHNIDLAPRVPIEVGDEVSLKGEYIWNDRGGLVHWTHHDPRQRQPGGWIRHDGRTYR